MENLLQTCCGSPAYAAPELICGKNYLGAEADLWSMGVLLYALLCGYLPFDDDNINLLYKKIQTGKYDVPSWLSQDSVNLLNDLLQVDPKKRVTMPQLVHHPWVLKGYSSSVDWQTRYYFKDLDRECLAEIALYFNKSLKDISDHIQTWSYDFLTATYFLLLFMKMQGRQAKIKSNMKKYSQFIANCTTGTSITSTTVNGSISITSTTLPPQSSTSAQTNANRILVEKQLASLSVTPKVPSPNTKINAQIPNFNVSAKPPQSSSSSSSSSSNETTKTGITNENAMPMIAGQPVTPFTKIPTPVTNNQKPKQLIFDEIKVSDNRSKQQQQQTMMPPAQPQRSNQIDSSESSSASSSSSESLSSSYATTTAATATTTDSSNNFVMPSRVNRAKNRETPIESRTSADKNECVKASGHASRAASASQSANNQDVVFIPPKTPVRSKTRETQYNTPSKLVSKSDSMKIKVTPSKSVDSDLNIFSPSTPVTRKSQSVENELNKIDTPSKRTPVFGSIERGLDKVKTIFTPRKRMNALETPKKAKDTCNITISNLQSADVIIEELINVVSSKHLLYERKGYSLRISVCDDWGRVKLAFDLEVVQLKTKQLGIRRKRVKGDTWHYKKYCEDVIKSANVCQSNTSMLNLPNSSQSTSTASASMSANQNKSPSFRPLLNQMQSAQAQMT